MGRKFVELRTHSWVKMEICPRDTERDKLIVAELMKAGLTKEEIAKSLIQGVMWKNPWYTVNVRELPAKDPANPPLIHLSIKRNDREPVHDWRDLQLIKNDILGPEQEAFELYPAESRLVDDANQYHLWCIPGFFLPSGFAERSVSDMALNGLAKQRPWPAGDRPEDCNTSMLAGIARLEARDQLGEL